ncbi:MAG TPA: glycosyl hydrolase family 18 protein [Xanthobacteraceae bacterium]
MSRTIGLPVLFAIALMSGPASAQSRMEPGEYQQNASFLSRRFLTDAKNAATLTDDFVRKADKSYKVRVLLPNGGLLDSTGTLDHAPFAVKVFLDHVNAYEQANGVTFALMPYLNGYSPQDTAHAANLRLDLENPAARAHIVAECGRYVSANVPGSYVRGAARPFDGIVLDLEPAGDPTFLASLKTLVQEIRASFDAMGLRNKSIGFAAPQYTDRTPKPNWGWSASDYYYLARYVNYVIAMTYDSGLTDESKYGPWMSDQTTRILQAVSGATWKFDAAHPKPANGVRVLLGLPGFGTPTKAHNPDVENVVHGAAGIADALSQLKSKDRASLSYFQGAAMYTHDGGAPDSPYARYDKDWLWWKNNWLGQ